MDTHFPLGGRPQAPNCFRVLRALAPLCALAFIHCGSEDPKSPASRVTAEPLRTACGDPARLLDSGPDAFRRPESGEAWLAPRARARYARPPHRRQVQTGFHERPRLEKVIARPDPGGVHLETVEHNPATSFGAELLFAPRIRMGPDAPWKELGWLVLEPEETEDRSVFKVPFDLSSEEIEPDQPIEIGLSIYASLTPREHAWESPTLDVKQDSVLSVGLGVIEAGQGEGTLAWRILACKEDDKEGEEEEPCECVYEEIRDAHDPELASWLDRRISLADWAGQSTVFRFETQSLNTEQNAVDPGLWSTPVLLEQVETPAVPRKNLLMISLDTLGADHLGLYGYERNTSPFIDEVLSPRSTVFMEAAAPATTTGPSHMTLFTSLAPSVHGFVSNISGTPLPEEVPTLAEILRQAGYLTGAINENGAINDKAGFDRGFDVYKENRSARLTVPEGHIESTFNFGRGFLESTRDAPSFAFLQTYQVHFPYRPPAAYEQLFGQDGLNPSGREQLFTQRRYRHHPVLYDREIRYTDEQLRRFLTELEESGLLENTVVVILADHGEAFFEHDYLGHGSELHRETVRVPLILMGPGIPEGLQVPQNVGLADVMPTVLELLEVPAPPDLMGRSLVPLMTDPEPEPDWTTRPIFSEAWQTRGDTRDGRVEVNQPTLAVRRDHFKLIRSLREDRKRHAFFDLSTDPREQEDLLAEEASLTKEQSLEFQALSTLLDQYEEETAYRAAQFKNQDVAPSDLEIDPERLEKLRALGYVD
ncbi:MAG: sulfatase [Myxococcota bacterium]|nr:sulfatase [Myxococcota bacterium]